MREAQKMEAIGQLGRASLLLDDVALSDPTRRNGERLRAAAERVATLTQQLLAFGRRQTLQPRVVDLNALVVRVAPMLRSIAGEAIHLEVVESPGLWPIQVDPDQIERVVSNLARNARDAMPSGGQLRIEAANVQAVDADVPEPDGAAVGDCVRLRVQTRVSGWIRGSWRGSSSPSSRRGSLGRERGWGWQSWTGS